MKEKIKRLSREEFDYELPDILLSQERIRITVEAGAVFFGSFMISNSQEKEMRGVIYSSSPQFRLTNAMFIGKNKEIQYSYNAKKAAAGDKENGNCYVVCNCGEHSIPFEVNVTEPFAKTTLGGINDLFHFANLSKSNWNEALKLFESVEFSKVFLKEEHIKSLYTSLMKGSSHEMALDEFLVSIQKKQKIKINCDMQQKVYKEVHTNFKDKVVLTKEGWGYEKLKISTDSPFLSIEKTEFTTKDFIGDTFDLEYVVETDFIRQGNNYGRILINTSLDQLAVDIRAFKERTGDQKDDRKLRKETIVLLTQNYLNLRTKKITHDSYIASLSDIIKQSKTFYPYWAGRLLELHLYIIAQQQGVPEQLKEMEKREKELKKDSSFYYEAFLYLKALYTKKEEDIKNAAEKIRICFEQDRGKWQYLWFLFYLDDIYDQEPMKRWQDLEAAFDLGVHSPILYYEACLCLTNDNNAKQYNAVHILRILAWGVKNEIVTPQLTSLFCFFVQQEKKADIWIINTLTMLYKQTQSKEVLYTICFVLIQNKKNNPSYFSWFQKGEQAQLKLENLYEYYLYTIKEDFQSKISPAVLLYFQYDSSIDWEKKAYLYAYIIKNKKKESGTYLNYDKAMRKFAVEQIKKERITPNLAILYEEFIKSEDVDERLSFSFAAIMFRNELICKDKNIKGVFLSHKELDREVYYPLNDGRGNVDIATESPSIVFVDEKGNRYLKTVNYELNQLMHISGLSQKCFEYCKNNILLLLHQFEKIDKYQNNDDSTIYVQRRCVLLPGIKDACKGSCYEKLICHYFDSMENETLIEILLMTDFSLLSREFRPKAITYCMIHNLYEKSVFLLKEYGFDGIAYNRLLRFCTDEINKQGMDKKDLFIMEMAFYIFDVEKYNETILHYLMLHYEGRIKTQLRIWNRAKNFELDTFLYEEHLLEQMLFCESYTIKAFEVFHSYYRNGGNERLIRAFLFYNAYKYLMHERNIHEEVFEIIKKESLYEESTVSLLALILHDSKQDELSKEELLFCEQGIEKMRKRAIIFPFFKCFAGRIQLSQEIETYYYVEYKCNPDNKVNIHYLLEDGGEKEDYTVQVMHNVYLGIHIIRFLMFQDETLQYYISENDGVKEFITESVRTDRKDQIQEIEEDGIFGALNLILTAREMKDDKTVLDLMKHFVKLNYIGDKLLKIL